jgi:hypothetical protein
MIDGALSALVRGGLVDQRPPADMLSPASLLSERGAVLPLDHARLLSLTNGLAVYGGYFRLFGIGPGATRDMRRWNAWTCWRHAWSEDGRADGWWFFGETVWGDQYAYATSDDPLAVDRTVYRLDVCHLEPEPIADGFADFLRDELARNAVDPRDEMTIAARERLGDIDPGTQIAYVPSLVTGGEEDVANLVTLPARAAMVAAGRAHRGSGLAAASI